MDDVLLKPRLDTSRFGSSPYRNGTSIRVVSTTNLFGLYRRAEIEEYTREFRPSEDSDAHRTRGCRSTPVVTEELKFIWGMEAVGMAEAAAERAAMGPMRLLGRRRSCWRRRWRRRQRWQRRGGRCDRQSLRRTMMARCASGVRGGSACALRNRLRPT